MRYVWISLLALALMPAVASAGDRYRGGHGHGHGHGHHGSGHSRSGSGFSISIGGGRSDGWHGDRSWSRVETSFHFGSGGGRYRDHSRWRGDHYYSHRPVIVAPPAYCPPPPVVIYRPAPVYCPPPVVYHAPPTYYRSAPCPPEYRSSGYSSTYSYGVYGR